MSGVCLPVRACPPRLLLQLDMDTGTGLGQDMLNPRAVDAYWLQRELNKFLQDAMVGGWGEGAAGRVCTAPPPPQQAVKTADEVLDVLKTAADDRDCENRLVMLLGYDHFDFVKLLLKNKLTGVSSRRAPPPGAPADPASWCVS